MPVPRLYSLARGQPRLAQHNALDLQLPQIRGRVTVVQRRHQLLVVVQLLVLVQAALAP